MQACVCNLVGNPNPDRAAGYPNIRKLLAHSDPGVRVRICKLVGDNLNPKIHPTP